MVDFKPEDVKLPAEWPGQVQGLARTILSFGGGYIVAKGWLTGEQAMQLAGIAVPVVVFAWGALTRHLHHKALNAAIMAPAGQAK